MDGYIKLHRKILDNPVVCKDAEYYAVWSYLLLNATHKEYLTIFKGNKITLFPGQLITGRKAIAKQFNVDESKVQRVLKKLEIEHQIEQQTSNENRLITILNWTEYQGSEQPNEQPVNNECTTDEQRVNTNKNVKNDKNIKNKEYQKKYSDDSFEMKCVLYLLRTIKEEMPNSKLPDTDKQIDSWCDCIEKMVRIDGRSQIDLWTTLEFARTDSFWKLNIRSSSKFREKYETLYLQMKNKKEPQKKAQTTNKFNQFPQRDNTTVIESLEERMLRRN